jgi:hypothetical protein
MSFTEDVDIAVGKVLAILEIVKKMSNEFRDPVRPKLEYASGVWRSFYDNLVNRIEHVQRKLARYAMWGQACMIFFHKKTDNALIRLETMCSRRALTWQICFAPLLNAVYYV